MLKRKPQAEDALEHHDPRKLKSYADIDGAPDARDASGFNPREPSMRVAEAPIPQPQFVPGRARNDMAPPPARNDPRSVPRQSGNIIPASNPIFQFRGLQQSVPKEFQRQNKSFYRPGQIIWMNHHDNFTPKVPRANMSQAEKMSLWTKNTRDSSNVSYTQGGVAVYTKSRPFIVVSTFADHFWAVPMATHEGTGLANVGDRDEHMYVRDCRLPYTEGREADSIYVPLSTQGIPMGESYYSRTSTVHFTEIISKRYNVDVFPAGALTNFSTVQLLNNLYEYLRRGLERSRIQAHDSERIPG